MSIAVRIAYSVNVLTLRVVRQQGMCLLPQKLRREDWSEMSAVAWHRSGGGVGVATQLWCCN
jgi:hypothetical protein